MKQIKYFNYILYKIVFFFKNVHNFCTAAIQIKFLKLYYCDFFYVGDIFAFLLSRNDLNIQ